MLKTYTDNCHSYPGITRLLNDSQKCIFMLALLGSCCWQSRNWSLYGWLVGARQSYAHRNAI